MNLYKISTEYRHVLENMIDPESGEINMMIADTLNVVSDKFQEKGIAIASFIKNMEAEHAAIDAAIVEMQKRRDAIKKRSESFNFYLKGAMEFCNITEISCPYFQVKIKKCPPSVEIINEKFIPEHYFKRKEVYSVDKAKLREDLNKGLEVQGAAIKQNTRIEIK